MEAEELKRRLAKVRTSGNRTYPGELREAVVRYASARRAERVGRSRIATELGMSAGTLEYWCGPTRPRTQFSPVTIIAAPEPAKDVVVECGTLRVRGLDMSALADLLRRLA